jgi:hypothetical protein
VLEGGNAAALRNADGAWEILQFANAELVDGQTYLLSRLLRGQGGSEVAMANPLPAGATFVVLGAHMIPIALGLDALARPMQLRIVASGRNHDDATAVALTATDGASRCRSAKRVRRIRSTFFPAVRWFAASPARRRWRFMRTPMSWRTSA